MVSNLVPVGSIEEVSDAFQVATTALTVGANELLNSDGHSGSCGLNLCGSDENLLSFDCLATPLDHITHCSLIL